MSTINELIETTQKYFKEHNEIECQGHDYGRDYYTEKARVELFKKIDEDYESIVRLSNAHFVE